MRFMTRQGVFWRGLLMLLATGVWADCGDKATPIHRIQGAGTASPLAETEVWVEARVSAVFNGQGQLGGFFLLEDPEDQDRNPKTSEGLYVHAPKANVRIGDQVRLRGRVREFHELTELTDVRDLRVCQQGLPVEAVTLRWPPAKLADLEAFEGMRVRLAQPLVVTDVYELHRYGTLVLASERHWIPTQRVDPGKAARTWAQRQQTDRLVLDDGSSRQWPQPLPWPPGAGVVRAGDQVASLEGVLDYRFKTWRIQPVGAVQFRADNPRPAVLPKPARDVLRVASVNLQNFFNGDGRGQGFPTARGAEDLAGFRLQSARLRAMLQALNADVIALMELENDGDGPLSSQQALLNLLGEPWRGVPVGDARLGRDEIRVGLIYRQDRVERVGSPMVLNKGAFAARNRPVLIQQVRLRGQGGGYTLAVNHFKSRLCRGAKGKEQDAGDGQGCWNPTRSQAAQALVDAFASANGPVLILGDLNAYAREQPLQILYKAGYTNLVTQALGESTPTYVYQGAAGALDHLLGNSALLAHIQAVHRFAANADEAPPSRAALDTPAYREQPWRASDHDPLVVDLAPP